MQNQQTIQNPAQPQKKQRPKGVRFYSNGKIESRCRYLHRTYGVSINYDDKKSVNYLLETKIIQKKEGLFYYKLNRKRFFKNGEQLNTFMDELAEKSVACLYPLVIKIDRNGEMVGVANQEEIEKRWQKNRKKIAKTYRGKVVEGYFETIDKAVSSEIDLRKSLANDMIYSLLFSNIYIPYTKAYHVNVLKTIPFIPNYKALVFNGQQEIDTDVAKNNRFSIHYNGELQNTSQIKDGNLKIRYQLDAEDYSVLRIDGKLTYTQQEKYKKVVIFNIIWQKNLDKTEESTIKAHKALGIYDDPNEPEPKWYEFWKYL